MRSLERAGYLAHSQTAGYRAHLERARATIRWALEHCAPVYVSWSAGKDSSVMLWLAAEECPTISARILTGGETRLLYPSLDRVIAWWRQRWPAMDLQEILVDHVFADGWQDASWVEQWRSFFNEWERYLNRSCGDWNGLMVGLRSEESWYRRVWLRKHLPGCDYAIYRYSDSRARASRGLYRICPLDRWTTADVAALTAQHDIPLLETYQFVGMEGRTHLRTGRRSVQEFGQIAELRRRDPVSYNRLIQRFPELARWS
jgi:3'-phosphoadenosine 5'-phosphosulfate sulfotransferase (PAPS reductase)/FAD synthetase